MIWSYSLESALAASKLLTDHTHASVEARDLVLGKQFDAQFRKGQRIGPPRARRLAAHMRVVEFPDEG